MDFVAISAGRVLMSLRSTISPGRCRVVLLAALFLSIVGCKSSKKHHASAVGHYDSGRAELALSSLAEADERRRAEHDIIAIDRALVRTYEWQRACVRSHTSVREEAA